MSRVSRRSTRSAGRQDRQRRLIEILGGRTRLQFANPTHGDPCSARLRGGRQDDLAGKLAKYLKDQGTSADAHVPADLQRPNAVSQRSRSWAAGRVVVFARPAAAVGDPVDDVPPRVAETELKLHDIVIIDTAQWRRRGTDGPAAQRTGRRIRPTRPCWSSMR